MEEEKRDDDIAWMGRGDDGMGEGKRWGGKDRGEVRGGKKGEGKSEGMEGKE